MSRQFAPPVETDILVDGKSVAIKFARLDWEQWETWEARIKKDQRDHYRASLDEEKDVPEAAKVKYPAEQTAAAIPLSVMAFTIASRPSYTFKVLIEQAVAAGHSKDDAEAAVRAIPATDRPQLVNALVTEEFKQEADRPLLVPLTRNPPSEPAKVIQQLQERIEELQKLLPSTPPPSSSPESVPSGPSSTLAA